MVAHKFGAGLLLAGGLALVGCAATSTAIGKRNLDVQTRMSDTIFLDPAPGGQRTVFVEVRNTSDKPDLEVASQVRQAIETRGYRVVSDPREADLLLQASVLQAGRTSRTASEAAYDSGFGGSLVGAATGGGVGYAIGRAGGGNDALLAAGGALVGAAVEGISGAFIQDVTYNIVTDVQISERAAPGVVVSETASSDLASGTSATRVQTSSATSDWHRYRTRIVSEANQANLDWPEAAPELVAGLSRSLAGIL